MDKALPLALAHSEFILGGQKSGKSRRAENLACAWLQQSPAHDSIFIATAISAGDEEMRERIARHQRDRAQRIPGMQTIEEPLDLARALTAHSQPKTLLVVDCMTLWLTNVLMPAEELKQKNPLMHDLQTQVETLLAALQSAPGPVVLVGNEIGLGVIPLGRETRAFVDALGGLNQQLAKVCERVTLMAAGLPLALKGSL